MKKSISQLDFNYDGHRGNKIKERYDNGSLNYQDKGLYENEAGGFTISQSGRNKGEYI